jgi:hypothetical protein
MVAIEIAVRVRPRSNQELENNVGEEPIIEDHLEPSGSTSLTIHGGKRDAATEKQFSCDRYYRSTVSQEKMFQSIGVETVDNAFSGWNTAIFAYGQTGSGKTYTMMGKGPGAGKEEMGIIPRVCNLLFSRIDADCQSVDVTASHFEVYNERVRDLCRPTEASATNLRVREHPKTGAYVERLSEVQVADYAQVQALLDKGAGARTTAATSMNDSSSRSHAVFTLRLRIRAKDKASESETAAAVSTRTMLGKAKNTDTKVRSKIRSIRSKICLVDLAGSERADTGVNGMSESMERSAEAKNINQSLRALGEVVSQLSLMSAQQKREQKKSAGESNSKSGGEGRGKRAPPVVRLSLTASTSSALRLRSHSDENAENVAPNIRRSGLQGLPGGLTGLPGQRVVDRGQGAVPTGKGKIGGKKSIHVPYRNSALTWLLKVRTVNLTHHLFVQCHTHHLFLQDCLGGNSKTIMIGCVSSAPTCLTQTLSTLRFLSTARRVQTGVVREKATVELVKDDQAVLRPGGISVDRLGGIPTSRASQIQFRVGRRDKQEQAANKVAANKVAANKVAINKGAINKVAANKVAVNKVAANKVAANKVAANKVAANKEAVKKVANTVDREREREDVKIRAQNTDLWTQNAQLLTQNAELESQMAVVEGKNTKLEGQKVQAAARLEACEAALASMDRSNKLLGQQLLDSHTFHARTSAAAENCVRKGEQRSDSALRAVGEHVQQWKQRNQALQSKLMHVEQARQDDAELCIVM